MRSVLLSLALAGAVATAALAADYRAPNNAFGQPDLRGIWTHNTLTPLQRDAALGQNLVLTDAEAQVLETEMREAYGRDGDYLGVFYTLGGSRVDPATMEGLMRVDGKAHSSLITYPANGRVPRAITGGAPSAQPARTGQMNDNPESRSTEDRCLAATFGGRLAPILQPGHDYNYYQIIQSKDAVVLLAELMHDSRIVHLNARHRADGVRPWFGDSIGRYEGRTLVVETTNYPRAQAFYGAWDNLKVTERFTRTAPSTIRYEFRVEDPTVWREAWGGVLEFHPSPRPELYEYACHEGNYRLEGILAGARNQESLILAR